MLNNNNNNNTSSNNNNNGSGARSSGASLAKVASPPCASLSTASSPRAAPQPPASPPLRHPSSSPTSSDSETAPQSPSLEERIRSLDEKYEKWSGSRALSAAGGDALAKLDASASERFRFRHKLLDMDLHEVQPSDIVKSVLAKRSVFDEDSKRLENFSEKYEPREFTGIISIGSVIGSTAGLTTTTGSSCASKVGLQYPFPSHPPVQLTSGTSITNMVGVNTSLSASLTPTTTMVSSALKSDPRIAQHNCIHPTPATPITPGTSMKTVSPELPPVSLPIGLGSGTAGSSGNGSLLSSNLGSVGSIHNLGASTHRGLSISATSASPTVSMASTASTDTFSTVVTTTATTAVPVTTLSMTASLAAITSASVLGTAPPTTTTSSIAPPSSITSSSNSSSSSLSSASSTDLPRSRLRKESGASSRESRDSRDGKDSRESKHSKSKDCQRRSRKEEADVERSRKDRDERETVNDAVETDSHGKDFKDNKELRYERKEREEKERRDKEDRDRQDRKDKEDRDRQERKEREEREKREKDEERRERERLDKERQEKDRREREEREREKKEKEENELKEKERQAKERIDRERREREEKERQERREREERERRERERKEREEREERERKEREMRLEREKQEKERLRREREEQERREKEERDRLERERRREEKERLERERKREREEKERLERERRKEKEEREKLEKEKREKEERERLEREKHEREKRREREDQERREKEKVEREKRREREEKEKEKREREDSKRQVSLQQPENHLHPSAVTSQSQSQATPAPVSNKRRCSSQDGPADEDAKRMKISDHRRDSKDRSRQNRRSEDRKHRNDSHRSSRESRESRDSKESSSGATQQDSRDGTGHGESTRETNSRDNSGKEKQKSKRSRSEKESRERSPRVTHEPEKEFMSRLELSKNVDSASSTEPASAGSNHTRGDTQQHHQQQQSTLNLHSDVDDGPLSTHEIQVARHPSATDTDSDEPKKHSIFDIVDDEPAYISMYDKVKARSTKNMQKLEEEKRQVRLKDKFSQLKQSRARREEKKQSTSWDGDSVSSKALTEDEATSESDSTRTKSLSRKGSRSRIHSDTSEEEEPFNNKVRKTVVKTERFLENDIDLGFADTEEKQNRLEAPTVIVNNVHKTIKEESRTSDEDERISISGFRRNRIIETINHERDSRKKSHKKKQKRQKNSISSEDNLKIEPTENPEHKSKANVITATAADCRPNHGAEPAAIATAPTTVVATSLENAEERMRVDKKQRSKKDKRRDRNGEDKAKARRKRLNRQEARDSQRMEDIFGPLSDDVDDAPSNPFFNRFGNMASENSAYASDSDGGRSPLDMDRTRRKTEKKRRHQPEDENSVDLAEAGREIEAKLLSMPSSPKAAAVCTEPSDHDVFRFTDDNDSIEPSTPSAAPEKIKEKKKKRKRSKEERSRKEYHHHHHHHHHHHEKSGELPYLGAEPSPPRASSPLISKTISPTLPTSREALLSPIPKVTTNVSTVSSITPPVVSGNIQAPKSEKKKDKFIPGFGIEIDETIHENAVKSISEPDERDSGQSRSGREEPEVPVPTTPPAQSEDKPRVAISQEETEDAVAALLEETFGASTEDFSYEGDEEETETDGVTEAPAEAPQEDVEEMQQAVESLNASTGEGDADLKPDTPQSEHDLQIDTDTDQEDPNYETFDLTQPPKTPDIPSFYKSPTKTLSVPPVLTTAEKVTELPFTPPITMPQGPMSLCSVIAHAWKLNEQKFREGSVQVETAAESGANIAISPERIAQTHRTSASASPPPPQYKQPALGPCSVPITSEVPKLSAASPRPSTVTVQPLYQRLPVSPQSQMVPPMRQASPRMQNVATVSCSSSSNTTTPLPPLVPSRIPPLVPSQLSPRVSQPLSPNGQWSRNPALSPHVPNVSKPSPPSTRIAVCVPISAQRLEAPVQQIYSTAATQQPVIQHASGMLAPAPGYPRGGLPPLTLNIPPRPYMPVPPLASAVQVKNSRDSSLGGKSVIETLLPVNPNEPQRLEEPKLSPAVIPEPTNKASTSPKVPSPNQPPTYIPETAKIEINASTSSPVFGKPVCVTDSYTMSSRTQKQIPVSITTDNNLLSPRQKQELSNLQLLTTHVPRSSTPSPVIVAHGQSHLCHKSVHNLGPPTVSSPNQPLIKTVVPIVSQQITPSVPSSLPNDKCVISQTSLPLTCSRQSPVSQSQLIKSHVPLVSTVSPTIIARVVPSTVSSASKSSTNEQATPEYLEPRNTQGQQLELDAEAQIGQTAQPMQLTPPVQSTQPIDEIKQELIDIKEEDMETMDEAKYNIAESEKPLAQSCIENDLKFKQEKQEITAEIAPCVPKVEVADAIVKTQTEIETEPVNEVKEEDVVKENDEVELDEEPVEDPLKEPSTDPLAIDSKEDAADSKEDSDYWSAKEVNIESVIKKVDALCDGEGNDVDDGAQQAESANSDSHDTNKNESDWFDTESTEGENKKGFASTDDHDEGVETCENESTKSRRGRTKSRRGSRGGVTTRRGGRNATAAVSHRRGGRSPRGSKHHVEKNKLPADVYEFHDDSEEDNAGRPRLILTIKSPGPNVTGPNAQPATPVAAVKEVPPEEFVSPAANTRKSRRLAERDGSRNTVDDVIEDVVRGSPVNKGLAGSTAGNVHATRRSTRHNSSPRNVQTTQQVVMPLTELRKSPRGGRKATRRTSENNDDSGEEKAKEAIATTPQETQKEESKLVQPESPKVEESPQAATPISSQKTVSQEPMTLIDPVTGMLIPMRESEEGQYIPVSTTSGQAQTTSSRNPLCEPRSGGLINASSTNEAPRAKAVSSENSSLSVPAEPKKEVVIEHVSCQSNVPIQPIQPQTSVITKPQSPAVQATSTITVAQSVPTACTTIITTVATTPTMTVAPQTIPPCSSQTKPTSLKAHVLNASKLVTSAQQQVVVTKPAAPSLPNQTIVQNIVKPPAQTIQGLNLQIPPGRVASPSLSPRAKQAAQLTAANGGKQGQPMSPVLNNTGAPPNPKQHLLQAAKQQTSTIVNMPQKLPINVHPASVNVATPAPRIHQPVSQPTALKGINGPPHPLNPKTHLLQAVVPTMVTGTVASSATQPHLVNPQSISAGISCGRPSGPKAPVRIRL